MLEERREQRGLRLAAGDEIDGAARARTAGDGHRTAEDLPACFAHAEARLGEGELGACLLEGRQHAVQPQLVVGHLIFAGHLRLA